MPEYNRLKIKDLRQIGKDMGLLHVDKDKKKDLIARIEKGRQLSDYSKKVLLEQAQNIGLLANSQMSKETIIKKLTSPTLWDLGEKRLREEARQRGVRLRGNMSNKAIIERIENPTAYYTVENLKRLAEDNNMKIKRGATRSELIERLMKASVISPAEKIEVSNIGVMSAPDAPLSLIDKIKRTVPKNALEDLGEYKSYVKNIRTDYLTSTRLGQIQRTLRKKEEKVRMEHNKLFALSRTQSALKQFAIVYTIGKEEDDTSFKGYDALTFLNEARRPLVQVLKVNKGIKVKLDFHCYMVREVLDVGRVINRFEFHSRIELNLAETDENELYGTTIDTIEDKIQTLEAEASGWTFHSVIKLEMHTVAYKPLNGGSYIKLPKQIADKKAIINMKNEDDKCFLWCVLRALNLVEKNNDRIDSNLKSKIDTLNMGDINYPVSLKDVSKFERLNPDIAISVFAYDESYNVYPLRISKHVDRLHKIKLLFMTEEEKTHYCLIKDFSRLVSSQVNKHNSKVYICERCMNPFKTEKALKEHEKHCNNEECVDLKMPKIGLEIFFKNIGRSERVPFIIYADTESLLKPISSCEPNPETSGTHKYQMHEPISFSYYIKCFDDSVCSLERRTYTG